MKIHFCRSKGIAAWLIRVGTMSAFNHVAVEVDGHIIHSTGARGVHQLARASDLKKDYYRIEAVSIEGVDREAAFGFLRGQLGKGYDWGAVFAMPFRAGWRDRYRWFCSELAAAALEAGGLKLRLPGYRITPRDLYVALPVTEGKPSVSAGAG